MPDLYLPEKKLWLEIKGPQPTVAELSKVAQFAIELEGNGQGEVCVLVGDIPYPYPREAHAVSSMQLIEEFSNLVPSEEKVSRECADDCWKQCPMCSRIDIAGWYSEFCKACLVKAGAVLEEWISGTLDATVDLTMLPKFINLEAFLNMGGNVRDLRNFPDFERGFELLPKLLNREFFRVGHKSRRLREAYGAAKSTRFEYGASGRSF